MKPMRIPNPVMNNNRLGQAKFFEAIIAQIYVNGDELQR